MNRKTKYESKFIKKSIRFTSDELTKVEKQRLKTSLDFTNYCKSVVMRRKIVTKIEKSLVYEINKIGTNLNQLARDTKNKKESILILKELVKIEQYLKSLLNDC